MQINWLGESVPEFKKGGFHVQLNQLSQILSGAHVTINARAQEDLDPDAILNKVADASGSKFSVNDTGRAPAARPVAPAPVGTAYQPIGTPDIAAMRAQAKPDAPTPVVSQHYGRMLILIRGSRERTIPHLGTSLPTFVKCRKLQQLQWRHPQPLQCSPLYQHRHRYLHLH